MRKFIYILFLVLLNSWSVSSKDRIELKLGGGINGIHTFNNDVKLKYKMGSYGFDSKYKPIGGFNFGVNYKISISEKSIITLGLSSYNIGFKKQYNTTYGELDKYKESKLFISLPVSYRFVFSDYFLSLGINNSFKVIDYYVFKWKDSSFNVNNSEYSFPPFSNNKYDLQLMLSIGRNLYNDKYFVALDMYKSLIKYRTNFDVYTTGINLMVGKYL